jgi:hypothetical protein
MGTRRCWGVYGLLWVPHGVQGIMLLTGPGAQKRQDPAGNCLYSFVVIIVLLWCLSVNLICYVLSANRCLWFYLLFAAPLRLDVFSYTLQIFSTVLSAKCNSCTRVVLHIPVLQTSVSSAYVIRSTVNMTNAHFMCRVS